MTDSSDSVTSSSSTASATFVVNQAMASVSPRTASSGDDRALHKRGYICGSAAYAAPEVVRGHPYNPKISDIWSLGIILFIMVNAAMPFDDSNLKKMLKDQQSRNWHLRSKVKDKLTDEIKDMMHNILEPDVTKRITVDKIAKHEWLTKPFPLLSPPGEKKTPPASGRSSRQKYKTMYRGDEASPSHRSKVQSDEPSLKDGESFFDLTIGNTERRYEENQRRRLLEQRRAEEREREERRKHRHQLLSDRLRARETNRLIGDSSVATPAYTSLRHRQQQRIRLRPDVDSVITRFRSSNVEMGDDLVLEEDETDDDDDDDDEEESQDSDDLLDPIKVGREFESMMSTS